MMDVPLKLGVVGLDGHGPVFVKGVNGSDSMLPTFRAAGFASRHHINEWSKKL